MTLHTVDREAFTCFLAPNVSLWFNHQYRWKELLGLDWTFEAQEAAKVWEQGVAVE